VQSRTIDEARRGILDNEDTVSMVSTLGFFVGVSYEASLMGFFYALACCNMAIKYTFITTFTVARSFLSFICLRVSSFAVEITPIDLEAV
jgi:hypothetical protein